jgi:hypothetical protein
MARNLIYSLWRFERERSNDQASIRPDSRRENVSGSSNPARRSHTQEGREIGGRIVFGANFVKTSTERTINMKEKSSKQSKKEKPAVKIKDLKPTKDARGGVLSKAEMIAQQQNLAQRNQAMDMQTSLVAKQAKAADQIIRNI